MRDSSDMELVREHARQNSEAAFAELVRRHINLVYSAALRHVGIPAQAEEITQAVFIILARKAAGLRADTVIEAWLYETTRLTALSFLRAERRRQFREQEAYMQSTLESETTTEPIWAQMAPLLDEAMMRLGAHEREAIVIRFFKDKSLGEAAAGLNISEAAAQKRVSRALEKLRKYFAKRGMNSTAVTIAAAIAANSVHAAPPALAETVTAVAAAKGAAASLSTLTLIKGALKIMAWTKAKMAVAAAVGILLTTGTAIVMVKEIRAHRIQAHQVFPWQTFDSKLAISIMEKLPPQVKIIPTRFPNGALDGGRTWSSISKDATGQAVGVNCSLSEIVRTIFGEDADPETKARTVLATNLSSQRYDFVDSFPKDARDKVVFELRKQLKVAVRFESRDADVFNLEAGTNQSGAKAGELLHGRMDLGQGANSLYSQTTTADLARRLEDYVNRPVINHTGIDNRFELSLKWAGMNGNSGSELQEILKDRLGLALVPAREPVELLVVEKAVD